MTQFPASPVSTTAGTLDLLANQRQSGFVAVILERLPTLREESPRSAPARGLGSRHRGGACVEAVFLVVTRLSFVILD